jgi:serine/threonine protein kinase
MIDDFQLKIGDIAPGWTPGWSAPEQALGDPVSIASDVYPVGLMIAEILGGQLVGEVRKFKTALGSDRREEFDVFYNPSVYVSPDSPNASGAVFRPWTDLARRCLRFRPEQRPQSMRQLGGEIETLLKACPLNSSCRVNMNANLVWATFLDGSDGLARVIRIDTRDTVQSSTTGRGAFVSTFDPQW